VHQAIIIIIIMVAKQVRKRKSMPREILTISRLAIDLDLLLQVLLLQNHIESANILSPASGLLLCCSHSFHAHPTPEKHTCARSRGKKFCTYEVADIQDAVRLSGGAIQNKLACGLLLLACSLALRDRLFLRMYIFLSAIPFKIHHDE
jgi:hypothetical protein